MAILAHAAGLSMGNTCQLPLLTPNIPEIGAGRVKSATARDCRRPFRKVRALFSTICGPSSTGCAQERDAFELR